MYIDNKSDIAPFWLTDRIAFVGSRAVSCHIIDTRGGLIMLDTGYPDMREQIPESMRVLGLKMEDVKIILHSHGHIDHFGSTEYFKKLSGAKTYIARPDNDICNGTLDLSWAKELGLERLPPFNCDVLLEDGDVIRLGDVSIRCVYAPGHTDGVLALFITVPGENGSYVAAMHGGIGLNSMKKTFLEEYGLSLDCRDQFRAGLHKLAKEHVDIVLGNHPNQSDTEGKLKKLLAGDNDAFRNPSEWPAFLKECERNLDRMLEEEV